MGKNRENGVTELAMDIVDIQRTKCSFRPRFVEDGAR